MNTSTHNITATRIQLNETFQRLVSGEATIRDILAERNAARAARLASEDAYARRHREWMESRDMFFRNLAY